MKRIIGASIIVAVSFTLGLVLGGRLYPQKTTDKIISVENKDQPLAPAGSASARVAHVSGTVPPSFKELALAGRKVEELDQRAALGAMDAKQLEASYQLAQAGPNNSKRMRTEKLILEFLARKDPNLAISLAMKSEGTRRANGLDGVMAGWITEDADAPFRWLTSNYNQLTSGQVGTLCSTLTQGALETRGASDSLIRQIMQAPVSFRESMLDQAMQRAAEDDPSAAINLLAAIDDKRMRNSAVHNIARSKALLDPRGAADWALSLPPDDLSAAIPAVVSEWTLSSPNVDPQFVDWMNNLPPSIPDKTLDSIVSRFSGIIGLRNPEAALPIISNINDSTARNRLLARMANTLTNSSTEMALKYAQTISVPDMRLKAMTSAYAKFYSTNAASTLTRLSTDPTLSDTERDSIKKSLSK